MDINEPKSRSFNIFLRYFQAGLQILVSCLISQISSSGCNSSYQKVTLILSLIVIVINLISMTVMRCSATFPRIFFFTFFIINVLISCIIIIFTLVGLTQMNVCANNKVLQRFVLIQMIIGVVLGFMILILPFHWVQRYTNTPGNLVWLFLFFGFTWTLNYQIPMLIEAVIAIVVSVLSFGVNTFACKGITTTIKKYIVIVWIFTLILIVAAQVLALVTYLGNMSSDVFADNIAIKLLQTFLCCNVLDFLFWLWGYLTLQYENGDKIRDQLMRNKMQVDDYSQNVEPYSMYPSAQPDLPFGTIKR